MRYTTLCVVIFSVFIIFNEDLYAQDCNCDRPMWQRESLRTNVEELIKYHSLFYTYSFTNPKNLIRKLKSNEPVSFVIKNSLSKEFQKQLADYKESEPPSAEFLQSLIKAFNELLNIGYTEMRTRYCNSIGDASISSLNNFGMILLPYNDGSRRMRFMLENIYPDEIAKCFDATVFIKSMEKRFSEIEEINKKNSENTEKMLINLLNNLPKQIATQEAIKLIKEEVKKELREELKKEILEELKKQAK